MSACTCYSRHDVRRARYATVDGIKKARRLTALHQRWRHYLAEHGVDHPAPQVAW